MFSTTSTSLPARGLYLGQFLRVGSKRKALRPDSFASRNAWRARSPFGSRTVAPHSGFSISCWIIDSMALLLPQPVGPRMSVCRKRSSAEIETGVGIGLMLGRLVRQTTRSPEDLLLSKMNSSFVDIVWWAQLNWTSICCSMKTGGEISGDGMELDG